MLTVTPKTIRIMEKHIPAGHPDWEVICNANPPEPQIERPHNPMAGMVLAAAVEILICLVLWGLMHWKGIL